MIRWLPLLIALFGVIVISGASSARPTDQRDLPTVEMPDLSGTPPKPAGILSLSSHSFVDTVYYGGTRWAADSLRWEALRDSVWTFDTGIGSSINTGQNPNKPVGYHQTMEGWFGLDETLVSTPYFRRSSTCAISGSFSMWAGRTEYEAFLNCYAAGQGFGNSWDVTLAKTFTYPGSGNVTLSYQFAVESEPGFDYTYVLIDTTGASGDKHLRNYTGVVSGTDVIVLTPGVSLRSTPGPVTIKFRVSSDGSYSDADGLYTSLCGHTAIDNVLLTGAITDFADFEVNEGGWAMVFPVTGLGDFSNLSHIGSLPPPAVFCPCAVQDSVLVFFNEMLRHPTDQTSLVISPWIDLKRGGDVGRPGRLMSYDLYAHLPQASSIYVTIKARYYPYICPNTGAARTSDFLDQNIVFYFGESPFCTTIGQQTRDYSGVIGAGAEQVQVAWGVIDLCGWTWDCSLPGGNSTPWLDNIRFGVYGSPGAPVITLTANDHLQDSFATDGTLNPASTGRLDPARLKNASSLVTGARMADTLVARGNGGNTEVRLVFQIRPGPFTNTTALLNRAARWTAAPFIAPSPDAAGGTWYSARLDTAEQNGAPSSGNWMSTFHESDPGFQFTDRTPDPVDPNELENEILPDHILTPGSRVDYFIASRYVPPDPRNVGGASWYISPDTSGGRYFEAEILPTSMDEDTTWNCTLYVDHHDDREFDQQAIEEAALTFALGSGGTTPEWTNYDRFDTSAPGQISLGRPLQSNAGASVTQLFGYRSILWAAGSSLSTNLLVNADAVALKPWLTLAAGGNHFWGSGDNLVTSMNASNDAAVLDLMQNVFGVTRTCGTIRDAACPVGTILDSTFCLPLGNLAGAAFATVLPANVSANGCPNLRSLDLLGVNPSVTTAKGQLDYVKNAAATSYASVTNELSGSSSKSVVDGFALGNLRTASGDPHNAAFCTDETAALLRVADVLGWFGGSLLCSPLLVTGVGDEDDFDGAPPLRPSLSAARPNPSSGRTTIVFVNAVENGRVTVQIFDVTGRLVRTLLDAPMTAGHHEVIWDGSNERGSPAAAGLYFYRLTAGDYAAAKRLVIVR